MVMCAAMSSWHRPVVVDDVDKTMELPLSRCLWDPGIRSTACRVNVNIAEMPLARMSQIDNNTNRDGVFLLFLLPWLFHSLPSLRPTRPMARQPLPLAPTASPFDPMVLCSRRATSMQWDPGIAKDGIFDLPTSHSNVVAVTMINDWPSVLMFHYCHPVLLRPTVPNIDS